MASFTYAGSAQPVLATIPGVIAGLTTAGEVNLIVNQFSNVTGLPTLLEVTANVGNKRYVKPSVDPLLPPFLSDTTLSIQFTSVGDYKVTLTATNYKPRSYLVKVRP